MATITTLLSIALLFIGIFVFAYLAWVISRVNNIAKKEEERIKNDANNTIIGTQIK